MKLGVDVTRVRPLSAEEVKSLPLGTEVYVTMYRRPVPHRVVRWGRKKRLQYMPWKDKNNVGSADEYVCIKEKLGYEVVDSSSYSSRNGRHYGLKV